MKWYFYVLRKYWDYSGRARRKEFWYFVLFVILFSSVLIRIDEYLGISGDELVKSMLGISGVTLRRFPEFGLLNGLHSLVMVIPFIAVSIRRLHDTGRSGWWLFVNFVPMIGGLVLLFCLAAESQPEKNRYG
ncbi:conserved hypothetical protein [Acaryochloris marina MBIC11017]|uniref:DUF805 domain-containing protein n=2 Tax=Acaryochloris marina TaxID=155978 RepID=B0C9A7_ACAM1|nr:conserved hypothetical protein [Acaryochloris marina MBIC11017]